MTLEEFEVLITEAINAIPPKVGARLDNVAFVVENYARPAGSREQPIVTRGVLLGLYQGVPLGSRGPHYTFTLPDKITIFKDSIERVSGDDPDKIRRQVFSTVHHEIAHFLGLDEAAVRRWEHRRLG